MSKQQNKYYNQRGDTLIEVLLSMIILSIIVIGASTLMNSGLRSSINAVEHTEVRNIIASQGELLRYVRDTYRSGSNDAISQVWKQLANPAAGYATTAAATSADNCTPGDGGKTAFYLSNNYVDVSQQPQITIQNYTGNVPSDTRQYAIPGRGMWIEGVASTGATPAYIDFYMRSCWSGLGGSAKQQVNSIVRLYVPEGS